MASLSGVLKSFSVGQISQVLAKSYKGKTTTGNKNDLTSLFDSSSAVQPVFVPVVEKEKKRKVGDEKVTEDEPKAKKKKNTSNTAIQGKNQEGKNEDKNKPKVKGTSQEDPERMARTVFVGNIPISLTKKALKKMFNKYGAIESVRFRSAALAKPNLSRTVGMKRKEYHKERHTMNAYIVFENKTQAEDAIQSNGEEVQGVHIRVDLAKNDKVHDHNRSVFVGNLPFGIEEEPLRELFKGCGDIESVRIVRDGKTGIGKGFGFILFKNKDSAVFALKLNQTKFNERPIRVFPSSENPRKGCVSKVKKGKPPTHSFSGTQAKKNQKINKPKHSKRKEQLTNKMGKKKFKDARTKRCVAYKQGLITKK